MRYIDQRFMIYHRSKLNVATLFSISLVSALFSLSAIAVVGGQKLDADAVFRQSTVLIYHLANDHVTSDYHCSGTLISKELVLTAAHCVAEWKHSKPQDFFVYFSDHEHGASFNPALSAGVDALEFHPSYMPLDKFGRIRNDLALIHFRKMIPTEVEIPSILDEAYILDSSSKFLARGYGLTKIDGGEESQIQREYQTYHLNMLVNEDTGMVELAGTKDEGMYEGDSGGPAYVFNSGQWKLWGIFSNFEISYGLADFEDLRKHLGWIRSAAIRLGSEFK